MSLAKILLAVSVSLTTTITYASDFAALDEALPKQVDAASIAPVFDFDSDGCLPAAGISRSGEMNGGLKTSGRVTGSCRSTNFMEQSNTVHRYACHITNNDTFCGHFYSLYFEKDQIVYGGGGHRHDWEYAAVWTKNGVVTHGSYSAHGKLTTKSAAELPFENGHLKIVYHKDGGSSHAFRFAGAHEPAENPYGRFVTPTIISWYEFTGDGWNNMVMRNLLTSFNYNKANLPVRESSFISEMNKYKPGSFPSFTYADALASSSTALETFSTFVNNASGYCMDITNGNMANGTNVMQWTCSGANWQAWYHDTKTGMIHSLRDPRFCLTATGIDNGSEVMISKCSGSHLQTFVKNDNGSFGFEENHLQVLDGYGTNEGDTIGIWGYWQGNNQKWTLR
jgi:hypothetical protein